MDEKQIQKREEVYKEIDLMDAVDVLLKMKWLILGITLAAALAAYLLGSMSPKIYRVSTSLQVGTVVRAGAEKLIEGAEQIKEKKNNDVYGVLVRQKLNMSQGSYPAIVTEIGNDTAIISFSTESSNVEQAKKVFEEINGIIISDHQKIYDSAKREIEENIAVEKNNKERMTSKIELMESDQTIIKQRIDLIQKMASGNFDSGNQMVILNEKEQLATTKQDIEDLYSRINEAERNMASLQTDLEIMQPTKAIKQPYVSETPVSPRVAVNAIVGGFFGFIIGVFIAIFLRRAQIIKSNGS